MKPTPQQRAIIDFPLEPLRVTAGAGTGKTTTMGWRLAQKILGTDQGTTGFDPVPFRAQPLYGGNPWFLRIVELYYRLKDRAEDAQRYHCNPP